MKSPLRALSILLLLWLPQWVLAEAKPLTAPSTVDPLTVILGLAATVGLIFLLAWFLRHFGGGVLMNPQGLKVVSALSVGPREKVVLIEAGDQQILLGVAPGRVTKIETFEQPIVVREPQPQGEFAQKLKQFIQPRGEERS